MLCTSGGFVLASDVSFARSPAERTRGLLGRRLAEGEALVIEPAAQIHTFGMRYRIDVVFCDRGLKIVHIARNVPPWRITRWVRGARLAIELPGGALPNSLSVGDLLEIG